MSEYVEIFRYHTKPGIDEDVFMRAAMPVTEWLQSYDPDLTRSVTQVGGQWHDVMIWSNKAAMDRSNAHFMDKWATGEFMAAIDPASLRRVTAPLADQSDA